MLVDREVELRRLDDLLDRARQSRARTLAVVGDAGIGKTALLETVADRARDFHLLRATGVPSEQSLGYAGLHALLRPLLPGIAALPARQRQALEECLGLGAPPRALAPDVLALGSGVLALLTAEAAAPLLVVVDDLQWWDDASRRVLAFAARRLRAEAVAVLVAARDRATASGVADEVLELAGLGATGATTVLRSRHRDLDPQVAATLVRRADGNPLALIEGAAELGADQRRGAAELPEPRLPGRVLAAYADRVTALEPPVRRALLLAACDGRGEVVTLAAAGVADADLAAASRAGLLQVEGDRVRLRHPLLAAAVLDIAGVESVAGAHRRLADALAVTDPHRALWHRAHATRGRDAALSSELSSLADDAAGRGAWESAAQAGERAADLCPEPVARADLLARAAEAWLAAGRPDRARQLLARLDGEPAAGTVQGAAAAVRAGLAALAGRWSRSARLWLAAAEQSADTRRTDALLEALYAAVEGDDPGLVPIVIDALEQLPARPPDAVSARHVAAAVRAARLVIAVDPHDLSRDEAVGAGMLAAAASVDVRAPRAVLDLHLVLANVAGRPAEGGRIARVLVESARDAGDVPRLVSALTSLAFSDYNLARWNRAYATVTEARQLMWSGPVPASFVDALFLAADIEAARGQAERCRSTCAELRELSDQLDAPVLGAIADRREGTLCLALNDLERAVVLLESAASRLRLAGVVHPFFSPAPELVEADLRLGRVEPARRAADAFAEHVADSAPPTARARLLRLRGLLSENGSYDADLTESAALDAMTGLVFHRARTLLLHGERLRRDRRRLDARPLLEEALAVFRSVEASPWAERAEAELAAAGSSTDQGVDGASAHLTPQELQVAVLVKEGLRNKEIAGRLYLSLRTVEFHLTSAYRKLGVASRTQLAARLSD